MTPSQSGLKGPFDARAVWDALALCDESYEPRPPEDAVQWVRARPYVLNHWFGFVKHSEREHGKSRADVVFRGTDSLKLGTWILTNGQAASVDPWDIGAVHQGFYRAWYRLWKNEGDPLGTYDPISALASPIVVVVRHPVRYFVIFGLAMAFLWCLSWREAATWAASIALVVSSIQSGLVEDMFRLPFGPKSKEPGGLAKYVPDPDQVQEIWFVGHSLGGALATLAFLDYRRQFPGANAYLITFAAPMVGNVRFVDSFEEKHKDRFLHVIHRRDPITYLPPQSADDLSALRSMSGLSYALLAFASACWTMITIAFRQSSYQRWREGTLVLGDRGSLDPFKHTRDSYRRSLTEEGICSSGLGDQVV